MPAEVHAIQLYQQGKLFVAEHAEHFKRQDSNRVSFLCIKNYLLFKYILISQITAVKIMMMMILIFHF